MLCPGCWKMPFDIHSGNPRPGVLIIVVVHDCHQAWPVSGLQQSHVLWISQPDDRDSCALPSPYACAGCCKRLAPLWRQEFCQPWRCLQDVNQSTAANTAVIFNRLLLILHDQKPGKGPANSDDMVQTGRPRGLVHNASLSAEAVVYA